eukprot:gene6466-11916_t
MKLLDELSMTAFGMEQGIITLLLLALFTSLVTYSKGLTFEDFFEELDRRENGARDPEELHNKLDPTDAQVDNLTEQEEEYDWTEAAQRRKDTVGFTKMLTFYHESVNYYLTKNCPACTSRVKNPKVIEKKVYVKTKCKPKKIFVNNCSEVTKPLKPPTKPSPPSRPSPPPSKPSPPPAKPAPQPPAKPSPPPAKPAPQPPAKPSPPPAKPAPPPVKPPSPPTKPAKSPATPTPPLIKPPPPPAKPKPNGGTQNSCGGLCKGISLRYRACFRDRSRRHRRTMPRLLETMRSKSSRFFSGFVVRRTNFKKALSVFICRCAKRALKLGYRAFGIGNYGECWSGPYAHSNFSKGGPSTGCINTSIKRCRRKTNCPCTGKKGSLSVYAVRRHKTKN